jgi:tetratricopeptide (TPR) repeat protein
MPRDLVAGLRARAKLGTGPFVLAAASEKELADEKLLHDCAAEQPACMAAIGTDLGADGQIYGSVASERAGYRVNVTLFDVAHAHIARSVTELIPAAESSGAPLAGWANRIYDKLASDALSTALPDVPSADELERILSTHETTLAACLGKGTDQATLLFTLDPDGTVTGDEVDRDEAPDDAASCMMDVLGTVSFPASKHGGKFAHEVKRGSCDVDALVAQGNGLMTTGDQVGALGRYEEAIACRPQSRLYQLAFMAACNAKNATKAATYWAKLSSDTQSRVLQMCVRNDITREQLEGAAACDVDDLRSKGMAQEQIGQHAAALASFEEAIRCQPSTQLYELSFMASCNAKSVSKSQYYWKYLAAPLREQLKQMCVRNGILPDTLDGLAGPTPDAASGKGQVRIDCIPQARVLFDGVESGTTPVLVKALPGKHKVTYVIGQDRYTYPVTVKAGYTETLSKDLQ